MKHGLASLTLLVVSGTACLSSGQAAPPSQQSSDWKQVDLALGRTGQMQAGDVYKFSLPRRDMHVVKDGVQVASGLALGSWLAFKRMGTETMVMGDLVLAPDEVEPVMLRLQQEGIDQTALHNHLLDETPRVMYMHIGGHGDAMHLAKGLAAALALTRTPGAVSAPAGPAPAVDLDVSAIQKILGYSGKVNGGILQFSIPRAEKIFDGSMEVPPAMGVATSINFQPTGGKRAAIAGDFVLLADEVNPVIQALRMNGIEVEAVHNHMLNDRPKLYFMHFWANSDAVTLAKGLRAALDKTHSMTPVTQ